MANPSELARGESEAEAEADQLRAKCESQRDKLNEWLKNLDARRAELERPS